MLVRQCSAQVSKMLVRHFRKMEDNLGDETFSELFYLLVLNG